MATYLSDLKNNVIGGASIKPVTAPAATVTGDAIDMQLSDGPVNVLLVTGTLSGGTNPTLAIKVQESDDNSSWSDTGSFSTLAGTDANGLFSWLGKHFRTKRYMRAHATVVGSPTAMPVSVMFLADAKVSGVGGGSLVT